MIPEPIARVVGLLLVFNATLAGAVTQTFTPAKDARLRSDDGGGCANTCGTCTTLLAGVNCVKPPCFTARSVLHFDLSAIPNGSSIDSATLELDVSGIINQGGNYQFSILRSRQPLWTENELIWEAYRCPAGDAAQFPWCSTGGDFDALATVVPWTVVGTGPQTISHANLRALVGDAVQQRGAQLHVFVKQNTESSAAWTVIQVRSREDANPSLRPKLTVTWTAPAPPSAPPWVTFRDETSTRLNVHSCTELSPPRPLGEQDRMEKDMAVGDFDKNGRPDVIVVRKEPFDTAGARKALLLMNEGGVLVDRSRQLPLQPDQTPTITDARDVVVADLDGDTWPDLVIATTCSTPPRFYRNRGLPAGGGAWQGFEDKTSAWQPSPYLADGQRFCAVAAGDLDGVGGVDLYLSNYDRVCTNDASTTPSQKDRILINNNVAGGGRFIDDTTARLGANATNNAFGTSVEIGDVDNDGKQDVARVITPNLHLLRNRGDPVHFAQPVPPQSIENVDVYMFTQGDLNGDGRLDFYVVRDVHDRVFVATPHPAPTPPTYANPAGAPTVGGPGSRTVFVGGNVKLSMVDGDADLDLGVADVDAEFQDSCNICCPGSKDCPKKFNECSVTGVMCTSPNHDSCTEDNLPGQGSNNPGFALLRNTGNFTASIQDPWPNATDQNFHLRTYDFAFLDIDGDGCMDLLQGLCRGYKVFMQNCPSTGTP